MAGSDEGLTAQPPARSATRFKGERRRSREEDAESAAGTGGGDDGAHDTGAPPATKRPRSDWGGSSGDPSAGRRSR